MKTLIRINELSKQYGPQILFDRASGMFSDENKIGVIGRNGAGKSTLCRIIIGSESPDQGEIWKSSELRLGYLEQQENHLPHETVLSFLVRMSKREEWFCAQTAWKFEIDHRMLGEEIAGIPGGFRTRAKLAAMLACEPNFLILDEPSNYLDLKTLILLEHFLMDFPGGYLVVSHDREFLKKTCEQTLEIENGAMTLFPGPVHDYLVFKEEQKELADKINRNLGVKQKQLERFIERFKSKASKATQAKSKMKQLERLKAMEIESDFALSTVAIRLPEIETRSGIALRTKDLTVGYPDRQVATQITWDIDRGEHVAILGDNGQGKTTLLRTLAGEIPSLSGDFQWGHGLSFGYYAQHVYSALPADMDILSVLTAAAPASTNTQQVLDMAGAFLFKGDDVKKMISVLSGGERSRVCLASLLLAGKQMLLLDEPTNHLDFETVEALGVALKNYKGTVFFISHDRTFVNLVATSILEVKNGRIIRYPGTYEEYVYSLECRVEESLGRPEESEDNQAERKGAGVQEDERVSRYELRKNLQAEIRKSQKQIQQCEEKQSQLQKEIAQLTKRMEENPETWTWESSIGYESLKKSLSDSENEWLELHSGIERMEKELSSL